MKKDVIAATKDSLPQHDPAIPILLSHIQKFDGTNYSHTQTGSAHDSATMSHVVAEAAYASVVTSKTTIRETSCGLWRSKRLYGWFGHKLRKELSWLLWIRFGRFDLAIPSVNHVSDVAIAG